ncbi:cytochrome c nitrite reductase small subunit [Campylobacter sp. VBCF_02 NA5]|uniref:cytochrome c nitrite reductase small subunit n=1 Tax=Campylobacter sp. VBCF_02 NA5 TaxID=2983834 RepID=UPI0022E9C3E3|nr:cytochrome c nitrite reductase small subunit [Campylobacter sp. VBCF_02 NA5]MDA3061501.1 cytochrome c nitrite reductase small subunit [Campylobacter sp. VBCF_02 NA5]
MITNKSSQKKPFSVAGLILSALIGLVFGFGVFTFVYADGLVHLSKDPIACKKCHVMNQVYESWEKGGHQHVATCGDCHLPHDFVGKWLMKAESGLHHGYAFTFKDNPVAFSASPKSKVIVQQNCIECHKEYAEPAIHAKQAGGSDVQNEALSCVSCHRQAGHAHNY